MALAEMNTEVFNTFKDQFIEEVSTLDELHENLDDPKIFKENINALFRIYHNSKAASAYLGLKGINDVVTKTESVLDIIRENGKLSGEQEYQWLLLVARQMHTWAAEFELGSKDPSEPNGEILPQVKVKENPFSANAVLLKLSVLYVDDDKDTAKRLFPSFKKLFGKVIYKEKDEDLMPILERYNPDFIIMSDTYLSTKSPLMSYVKKQKNTLPVLVFTPKLVQKTILKFIMHGVHYHLSRPIKGNDLKKVLYSVVKTHFVSRKMIISNRKIQSFIESLEPLSETINVIQEICDNEDASIADLIKVVKHDPITSGIILSAGQSPIYALENVNSIERAVSIFGKRTVRAMALSGLSRGFNCNDLSMYGINEPIFTEIAHLRMSLMTNWYQEVNKALLNKLSITALLGNMGQMLIAKEISNMDAEEKFKETVQKYGTQTAEQTFLQTTTPQVTSDILYFWNLPSDLIDSISYSETPLDAVDDIRPLAVANHIIYSLVPITGAKILPITSQIADLMKREKLNIQTLEK
ncbi:MAG: HDOD domain-containing protein, partial [Thiovulaceae bacterium]|nr:HDOD domain-containing protein [Sulfurimonadaceae bacterium]